MPPARRGTRWVTAGSLLVVGLLVGLPSMAHPDHHQPTQQGSNAGGQQHGQPHHHHDHSH
jgi:hypothetical protein